MGGLQVATGYVHQAASVFIKNIYIHIAWKETSLCLFFKD